MAQLIVWIVASLKADPEYSIYGDFINVWSIATFTNVYAIMSYIGAQ